MSSHLNSMDYKFTLRTAEGTIIPLQSNEELCTSEQIMIDKAKEDMLCCPGKEEILETSQGLSFPATFLDRGSNKLMIIGQGIGEAKERMLFYARIFYDYDILIFDYRWHDFKKFITDLDTLTAPFASLMDATKEEVIAVVERSRQMKHYEKVVGLGVCYSAYTFLAAQVAAQRGGVRLFDALILDSCPASLTDIAERILSNLTLITDPRQAGEPGYLQALWRLTHVPQVLAKLVTFFEGYSSLSLCSELVDLPVLFIHGSTDRLVPMTSFEQIWDSLRSKKKMAFITPNEHVMNIEYQTDYKIMCDRFISTLSSKKCVASFEQYGLARAQEKDRPIVVILTSNGGGGHMAATHALESYLKDYYNIEYKYVLEDSLPLKRLGISGEQKYNELVKYTSNGFVLNSIFYAGRAYFKLYARSIEECLRTYLQEKKPHLVISVVPMINNSVFKVTADLNIPFLLSPTDIDISTFLLDFSGSVHPCFKFNVLFQDKDVSSKLLEAKIHPMAHVSLGFPLRQDFYQKKDVEAIKREYALDPKKPVLLLMMGSQGSQIITEYVKRLTQVPLPFHLIVCIGKNTSLVPDIEKVAQFKKGTTYAIQGMTDRIADLMAVSDIFITKSGTASVCEAIQMRLPMILDATIPLIQWEQYNHDFVERHDLGRSIREAFMIAPVVTSLLENETYKKLRLNFDRFNQSHVREKVQRLAQSMGVRPLMPAKL